MFLTFTVAMPLAISLAVIAGTYFATRRKPDHPARAWAVPVAVTLPLIAASSAIINRAPEWPPTDAAGWMIFLGVAALLIGLLDVAIKPRLAAAIVTTGLVAAFAVFMLQKPLHSAVVNYMGEGSTKTAWFVGIVALYVVPALAGRAGARSTPSYGPVFGLGLLVATLIGWSLVSATAMYAQFASLLGLGLAPLGVATLLTRWPASRGLIPAFVVLNTTLWLIVNFYAKGSDLPAILGALAPAALLVGRIPALAAKPKLAGIAQAAAVAAIGIAAVGIEASSQPPKTDAANDYSDAY